MISRMPFAACKHHHWENYKNCLEFPEIISSWANSRQVVGEKFLWNPYNSLLMMYQLRIGLIPRFIYQLRDYHHIKTRRFFFLSSFNELQIQWLFYFPVQIMKNDKEHEMNKSSRSPRGSSVRLINVMWCLEFVLFHWSEFPGCRTLVFFRNDIRLSLLLIFLFNMLEEVIKAFQSTTGPKPLRIILRRSCH